MSTAHLQVLRAWRGGGTDGRPGWVVQFRYSEPGVRRLKALVPAADRQWDDTAKVWWFADDVLPQVMKVAPALELYTAQKNLL